MLKAILYAHMYPVKAMDHELNKSEICPTDRVGKNYLDLSE